MGPILLQGPILRVCSDTPRFSYRVLKTRVMGVGHCSNGHVRARGVYQGCTRGGYTGGCLGGLYRGTTQPPSCCEEEPRSTSEAGPGRPAGPGVGGCGSGDYLVFGGGAAPVPTLRARSVPCRALPGTGPLGMPPLGQYGRDLTSFSINLVKTA